MPLEIARARSAPIFLMVLTFYTISGSLQPAVRLPNHCLFGAKFHTHEEKGDEKISVVYNRRSAVFNARDEYSQYGSAC